MKNNKILNKNFHWYDIVLIFLCIIISIIYIIFSSGLFDSKLYNPLSNIIFAIFNILTTIFITYKISYFISFNYHLQNQKKIAKTSIRYLRGYLNNLKKLEKLVTGYMEKIKNNLIKQYFIEIQNVIIIIREAVSNSEYDFKDIVDEEYKEEHKILTEVQNELNLLKERNDELELLLKQKNKTESEDINKIKNEIAEIKIKVNDNINKLPFGTQSLSSAYDNHSSLGLSAFNKDFFNTGLNSDFIGVVGGYTNFEKDKKK